MVKVARANLLRPQLDAGGLWLLSDPHFGRGEAADDAGQGIDAWCQKIALAAKRWRIEVGWLGDVFELQQASWDDIWQAHGQALEAVMSVTSFIIPGNHDWEVLAKALRHDLPSCMRNVEVTPVLWQENVWMEHGHFHDTTAAKYPWICNKVVWLVGWGERLVHRDLDVWASKAWSKLQGVGRYGENSRYTEAVACEAAKHDCCMAIYGHTHEFDAAGTAALNGVQVFNTGTLTNGHREGLVFMPSESSGAA
jgi:UDP-2,3-diacylglucosamine pyrophosphatase LpxH